MHMTRSVQSPVPIIAKIGQMRNNRIGEFSHSFYCNDNNNDNNYDNDNINDDDDKSKDSSN